MPLSVLTPEEAAKALKVSSKTVYRWIAAKRLKASKLGRKTYRIQEKDLVLFLSRHR
ncbi:excisionase [bacterium]|nr:excisionase [bacterium]